MINFAPMISAVSPRYTKSCNLVNSTISSLSVTQCINLDTASSALIGSSDYITVNKTWINSINPNIDASKTILVQFNQILAINL